MRWEEPDFAIWIIKRRVVKKQQKFARKRWGRAGGSRTWCLLRSRVLSRAGGAVDTTCHGYRKVEKTIGSIDFSLTFFCSLAHKS